MPTIGHIGQRLDLTIRQGADFGPVQFTVRDAAGIAVNLTGCQVRGQIRTKALAAMLTVALNTLLQDAANGVVRFWLTAAATMAISAGESLRETASKYEWDLEIEWPNGRIDPLFWGSVRVHREVTR